MLQGWSTILRALPNQGSFGRGSKAQSNRKGQSKSNQAISAKHFPHGSQWNKYHRDQKKEKCNVAFSSLKGVTITKGV